MSFFAQQQHCVSDIKNTFENFIQDRIQPSTRLHQAILYALSNLGKVIRPMLVYATGTMLGASRHHLHQAAAAIELMHVYSLIHDDLPAMDNDSLRRGKPTVHCQFDEATAILAGSAIQVFGFEILSTPCAQYKPQVQLQLIQSLAHAGGLSGICLGQSLDLFAENKKLDLQQLSRIHQYKTQSLLKCAVHFGYICSQIDDTKTCELLDSFANDIGLAYQIQDDILDIESDDQKLGKPQGSDEKKKKSTYPKIIGLAAARDLVRELHERALSTLVNLPYNTKDLQDITQSLVCRTY